MDNIGYGQPSIQGASSAPKPISEHQGAMGRLEERIHELRKNIDVLVERLQPVSNMQELANKQDGAIHPVPPAHPVHVISELNKLEIYVADHVCIVKDAIERLAI